MRTGQYTHMSRMEPQSLFPPQKQQLSSPQAATRLKTTEKQTTPSLKTIQPPPSKPPPKRPAQQKQQSCVEEEANQTRKKQPQNRVPSNAQQRTQTHNMATPYLSLLSTVHILLGTLNKPHKKNGKGSPLHFSFKSLISGSIYSASIALRKTPDIPRALAFPKTFQFPKATKVSVPTLPRSTKSNT